MEKITQKPIYPTPRLPDAKVVDLGTVRFGDGTITKVSVTTRRPDASVVDKGEVRFGDGTITRSR
ncbi:MAG TPA: hypothetical protein VHW66_18885 [Stellaceae bacterium]|jgi:hypothetical protein|nr:hypothetical protein [Stellaceae bacterium]